MGEKSLLQFSHVQAQTELGRSATYAAVATGRSPVPLKRGAVSPWIKS